MVLVTQPMPSNVQTRTEILLRHGRALVILSLCLGLGACGSKRLTVPGVEDRSTRSPAAAAALQAMQADGAATSPAPAAPSPTVAEAPKPGAENAGKPGYYTVKPGDTMTRIGLETGQSWRDIARWNNLEKSTTIEPGQVLRVVPPGPDPTAVAPKPVTTTRVEPRPLDLKPAITAPAATAAAPAAPPAAIAPPPAAPAPAAPVAATPRDDDEPTWIWPASGAVMAAYDEARNKGVSIGGKAGDAVVAAADGRVVYAGSGLRGYGNLVILKHNATYLTAYAHNQNLLVKEDQQVKRGQKIAEMGATDAERVQLHFEIRRLGKPVDPVKLLPPR
jgi:lipoprotein NlpD